MGEHAEIFDQTIRGATEAIIKRPLPNEAYDQACVSTRFGGLGIRKVTEHAPVAFKASYVRAAGSVANNGSTQTLFLTTRRVNVLGLRESTERLWIV